MRKAHVVALTALVAVVLATALPASAITNGQADGDEHPYVGLVVFDVINAAGQQVPSHRCSGSLLTPTVFLTAAHCTVGTVAARVWFDEVVRATRSTRSAVPRPTTASPTRTRTSAPAVATACRTSQTATSGRRPRRRRADHPCRRVCRPSRGWPRRHARQQDAGRLRRLWRPVAGEHSRQPAAEAAAVLPLDRPGQRMFAPGEIVSGNFKHSAEFIRFSLNPGGAPAAPASVTRVGPTCSAGRTPSWRSTPTSRTTTAAVSATPPVWTSRLSWPGSRRSCDLTDRQFCLTTEGAHAAPSVVRRNCGLARAGPGRRASLDGSSDR